MFMKKTKKGALAIEATIAFTVFITFLFMLIAIARLSMVYITINDVTSETAKRIAGMSYPISFVNDMYDNIGEKIKTQTNVDNVSFKLMTKVNKGKDSTNSIVQSLGLSIGNEALDKTGITSLLNNAKDTAINTVFSSIENFIENKELELVSNIYADLIEKTQMPIDTDNINVVCFSMPLPKTTFDRQKSDIAAKIGINAEDLNRDDVILCVEYDYQISVPFFPTYDVKLKSTAIERAWLHGGNHVTPSEREGIDISKLLGESVYYTTSGNGKRYHKSDCITLRRSNGINSCSRKQAQSGVEIDGNTVKLKPCAICRPDSD